MSRERVLALLREQQGAYLSGEAMSRTLGISRAGVWKAIEGLRQEGYTIASAPNRGYCLEDAPDRLRVGELFGLLSDAKIGSQLLCLDVIDSTNTECKRRAMDGAPEGLVVTAEEHTIIGGLGGAVCEALCEDYPVPVCRIGINDVFGESGSAGALLVKYGLDGDGVYRRVKEFLAK